MNRGLLLPTGASERVGSAGLRRSGPAEAGTTNGCLRRCCLTLGVVWFALGVAACLGCAPQTPPATVEGTVRLGGKPLDNCLVTFFPESAQAAAWTCSSGLTDPQGRFRLRASSQQEGAGLGMHRVTIQDMSVSTGLVRRDNGTVDMEAGEAKVPAPVRRSRVPERYASLTATPLSKEITPGHQVMDLDIP